MGGNTRELARSGRRSEPGLWICAYCLGWLARLTRDHIFATSWNPVPNPISEWTVGAREACNHRFGKLEINLRDLLAICLVPGGSFAQTVIARARQNFNPRLAKTDADRRARASRQRQLFATGQFSPDSPVERAVPFSLGNLVASHAIMIPIHGDNLITIVQKWTRGVHLKLTKEFIEPDCEVRVLHLHGQEEEEFVKVVSGLVKIYQVNPSVAVLYAPIPDENGGRPLHLYGFELWRQYRVYGWILDPRAIQELKQP